MKDDIGDRMKLYEMAEAGRKLIPLLPVVARLDGKCFSNFTKDMARPFDVRLSRAMVETAKYLAVEMNACVAYTQSDEISLAWLQTDYKSQMIFDGRVQKLCSVLASMCTWAFCGHAAGNGIVTCTVPALFDCRVWNVPSVEEGANVFLWREKDATKNSVSMAARCYYSHKELHNKSCSDMQEMLHQRGVNWNDYPAHFKRGTFIQRRTTLRKFTADELSALPPQHEARANPDLEVERSDFAMLEMPPFDKVTNRAGVIFRGERPEVV